MRASWGVEVDHGKDGGDGRAGELGGGGGVRRRRRRRRCYGEGVVLGVNFLTGIRRGCFSGDHHPNSAGAGNNILAYPLLSNPSPDSPPRRQFQPRASPREKRLFSLHHVHYNTILDTAPARGLQHKTPASFCRFVAPPSTLASLGLTDGSALDSCAGPLLPSRGSLHATSICRRCWGLRARTVNPTTGVARARLRRPLESPVWSRGRHAFA